MLVREQRELMRGLRFVLAIGLSAPVFLFVQHRSDLAYASFVDADVRDNEKFSFAFWSTMMIWTICACGAFVVAATSWPQSELPKLLRKLVRVFLGGLAVVCVVGTLGFVWWYYGSDDFRQS